MSGTEQPQLAVNGTTGANAAAELADIQRRQERVIKTVLVPLWYWWAMAAALVAIGAARDSHDGVVLATVIPPTVLVMAALTIAMIPQARRRVQLHGAAQPGARGAAAIAGLIVLVIAVTIATAASLSANGITHPFTIGDAAGGAVLVVAGPIVMAYCRTLMLSKVRQHMNDTERGGTP